MLCGFYLSETVIKIYPFTHNSIIVHTFLFFDDFIKDIYNTLMYFPLQEIELHYI